MCEGLAFEDQAVLYQEARIQSLLQVQPCTASAFYMIAQRRFDCLCWLVITSMSLISPGHGGEETVDHKVFGIRRSRTQEENNRTIHARKP